MSGGALVDEALCPQPRSEYAIARLAAEHLIAAHCLDVSLVVFRLTNGVGPPVSPSVDRWSLVANDLCRQAVTSASLRLRSSGHQWRDFIALDDVVEVLLAAADPSTVDPGTYNLGSGRPMTVLDLAETVAREARRAGLGDLQVATMSSDPAPGPPPYRVSTAKLYGAGLGVGTAISSAIFETLEFCVRHRAELADNGRANSA
jgi:UDP-glucose 4-epimerase